MHRLKYEDESASHAYPIDRWTNTLHSNIEPQPPERRSEHETLTPVVTGMFTFADLGFTFNMLDKIRNNVQCNFFPGNPPSNFGILDPFRQKTLIPFTSGALSTAWVYKRTSAPYQPPWRYVRRFRCAGHVTQDTLPREKPAGVSPHAVHPHPLSSWYWKLTIFFYCPSCGSFLAHSYNYINKPQRSNVFCLPFNLWVFKDPDIQNKSHFSHANVSA